MDKSLSVLLREAEDLTLALIEGDGEVTESLEENLLNNKIELQSKIDAYCFVIKSLKAKAELASERIKEWAKVAEAAEKSKEWLEGRLIDAINRVGTQQISGNEFQAKIQFNPPSCHLIDESKVPGEFIITETKTTSRIDKKGIIDAIKDGRSVPGATAIRTPRLVVKTSPRKEIETSKAVEKL